MPSPTTATSTTGPTTTTPPEAPPPPPPKWDAEGLARTISNMIIISGVVTCLGLAVAAVGEVDSESTVVFLLLVPTFFGGGCLLTLVNISWMSRRPNKRCSLIQLACNLVLLMMTLYVELLFWSYRRDIALAILCAAALPMLIFINMPSVFMITRAQGGEEEADTVVMADDEHSLFDTVVVDVEKPNDDNNNNDCVEEEEGIESVVAAAAIPEQQPTETQQSAAGEQNPESEEGQQQQAVPDDDSSEVQVKPDDSSDEDNQGLDQSRLANLQSV